MDSKVTKYELAQRRIRKQCEKEIKRASKSNKNIEQDLKMAFDAGYIDYLNHLKSSVDPKPIDYWLNRSVQVVLNTGLVNLALHRLKNLVKDTPDAEDIAYLALVKAIDTFDPSRGFAFSTLAYRIILNEIISASKKSQRQLVEDQPVPLYSSEKLILVKVKDASGIRKVKGLNNKKFYDLNFLNMSREEIVFNKIFNFSIESHPLGSLFNKGDLVGWHLQPKYKPLSLDQDYEGSNDKNRTSLSDSVEDEHPLPDKLLIRKDAEVKRIVAQALRTLNRTEQTVFTLAFPMNGKKGLGISNISSMLSISTGRVKTARDRSQIIVRQALIKEGLDTEMLKN